MKIDQWQPNQRVRVLTAGTNHISEIDAVRGWTTDRSPFRLNGVSRIEVMLDNHCLVTPQCNRVQYVKGESK